MLDLRRMTLLSDLADLGTVTAVAERRRITSSAVSQQLRVLEEEAGATLFRRDGRTLGLTRSGQVLAEHVRHVLAAVDDAMSAVAATRDRVSGEITVAAFNMGISTLVAPVLGHLNIEEPDLRIHVQQETSPGALRLLRQGEIDVAITCAYDFLGQAPLGGLSSETLLFEPLVLLAPADLHALVRAEGLAALADLSWVTGPHNSGLGLALLHAAENAGFTPKVKHRLVGAQNICDLAATQITAAIVPLLSVPTRLETLIVPGLDLGGRTIDAVVRAGRQRDPNLVVLLRTLHRVAEMAVPVDKLSVAS